MPERRKEKDQMSFFISLSSYSYCHLTKSLTSKSLHITSLDLPKHDFSNNFVEVSIGWWGCVVPRGLVWGFKGVENTDSEGSRTLLPQVEEVQRV
ncbi:hypothetical protein JHK82_040263 [Glycine max]|nr:hypothetical protein JHK82_040263 [Glycine max]